MIPSAPRVVVVGAGRMGSHHLLALVGSPSLRLVGIVERDPARHTELCGRFGVPVRCSLSELCNVTLPDAAIVATPDPTHVELALACLSLGLHALVEKPLAPGWREASLLAEAFHRAGRVLHVGMIERHNPAWEAFLAEIPCVGEIRSLQIVRTSLGAPPSSAGILHDLAIHDLDLLRGWSLGGPSFPAFEIDLSRDRVVLAGQEPFAWTLRAQWGDAPPDRSWSLRGGLGELRLDLRHQTLVRRVGDLQAASVPIAEGDALRREHAAFSSSICSEESRDPFGISRHIEILELLDRLRDRPALESPEGPST